MSKRTNEDLRQWAIEQAVILITTAPDTHSAPRESVEALADRLVAYVKQGK